MSTRLGIDFFPGLQEGLILDRGLLVVHSIALTCSCKVEDTFAGIRGDGKERRTNAFCPRCAQTGWLYRDPGLMRGMITNIRYQKNILDVGIIQPGDLLFSPLPAAEANDTCGGSEVVRAVGNWDKITATWPSPVDGGQVIVRGAASTGENVALNTYLTADEDRIWYEPNKAIWCEDDQGITYTQNSDFILGPGKIIKWVGNSPKINQIYTLKYEAFYEWIVFIPNNERIDRDGIDLGGSVNLRKRHVVFINQSPIATAEDLISFKTRTSC